MSDVVSLARRVGLVEVAPQFSNYSKVIIHVDDETVIEVGDDTGRALEFDNPFGTQQMAQDILTKLTGYQYQPAKVTDALLDPAAEIGDAANVRGSYFGIYQRERRFLEAMPADISAPQDEEINHEYHFETPQNREFRRQIDDVKASLIIANDRIDASVSQTGGEQSSFGWSLTSDGHRWYANNKEVMAVTASGLKVTGEIEATTGKIGGFDIGAKALSYNGLNWGDTNKTSGAYIGQSGIQLGKKFSVDNSGNVTATRLTIDTLVIGGTNVSAATLNSRANSAYTSTSSGGYCYNGATYGRNFNNASSETGTNPNGFTCKVLNNTSNYMKFYGNTLTLKTIVINSKIYHLLGYGG